MTDDAKAGCGSAIVLAVLLLGWLLFGAIFGEMTYSEGRRDGLVQKVGRQGLLWKTHEGELATAGLRSHGDSASNTWLFTVHDPAVVEKLNGLRGDRVVRLRYRKVFCGMPWNGETGYRVTAVEDLPGEAK